jgi:hypothetical protein
MLPDGRSSLIFYRAGGFEKRFIDFYIAGIFILVLAKFLHSMCTANFNFNGRKISGL